MPQFKDVTSALHYLNDVIDKNGVITSRIDDNGVFTYLHNAPTYIRDIFIDDCPIKQTKNSLLVSFPRYGDLLLNIFIHGHFQKAEIFQYNYLDRKITYATKECNEESLLSVLNPFPSGIPLLTCNKNFYLEVHQPASNLEVKAEYVFLDTISRKKLGNWIMEGEGVKVVHQNVSVYQVVGMAHMGHSPNCFVREKMQ